MGTLTYFFETLLRLAVKVTISTETQLLIEYVCNIDENNKCHQVTMLRGTLSIHQKENFGLALNSSSTGTCAVNSGVLETASPVLCQTQASPT